MNVKPLSETELDSVGSGLEGDGDLIVRLVSELRALRAAAQGALNNSMHTIDCDTRAFATEDQEEHCNCWVRELKALLPSEEK